MNIEAIIENLVARRARLERYVAKGFSSRRYKKLAHAAIQRAIESARRSDELESRMVEENILNRYDNPSKRRATRRA